MDLLEHLIARPGETGCSSVPRTTPITYVSPVTSPNRSLASCRSGVTCTTIVPPSRRTVSATVFPPESRMPAASASHVATGRPSIAVTRSPSRSPAVAAGKPELTDATSGRSEGTATP